MTALLLVADPAQAQQSARIAVLGLFHPHTLLLTAREPLTLKTDRQTITLDPKRIARLTSTADGLLLDALAIQTLTIPEADFTLTVPNKLTRPYRAAATITSRNGILQAVLTMPVERAVASIVAAEAPPHAPLEALKAQAVVSRSFLLAHPAHRAQGYDACDTTHCQWMRSPPPAASAAARATASTRGEVLTWLPPGATMPELVAARFSRACGGHTHPLPNTQQADYPFYAVACVYCLRHKVSAQGHSVGMCQTGAAALAAKGSSYREILRLYFPNTTVTSSRIRRSRHGED